MNSLANIFWFLIIGLAAGWLGNRIMNGSSRDLWANLIIGVIGSILGGVLFGLLGLAAVGLVGNLVCAVVGSVVLIAALRQIRRM